eukprot:XP_011683050.1 PREDICTED: hyalin isoform X2 [Strongylocentrotus purpuratus]
MVSVYIRAMDIHFPRSLREIRHCVCRIAFLLLVTRTLLIDAQTCQAGDNDGPTLSCISSINLGNNVPNTFFGVTMASGQFTANDGSGINIAIEYEPPVGDPTAGGFLFPPGPTTLRVTVSDLCDNPSPCDIEIINTLTELPVTNCPGFPGVADVSTDADAATFEFDPSYGPDDVNTRGTYYYHGPSKMPTVEFSTNPTLTGPPFMFPVGSTDLTTTISDTELSFQCTSAIVVKDQQNPVVVCPADFTTNTLTELFSEVVVTDNADPAPALTYDPLGPGSVFPLGPTTVTVTAIDSSSNQHSCSFTVTVTDNVNPVVTCPADFTSDTLTVSFSADVTDNVDPAPALTYDPVGPGSVFPLGPTTVTVTAIDSSSNQHSCSFTVTVTDNVNPVVACPADFTSDTLTVSFSADVTDNVDPAPALTYDPVGPGSVFPLGPTTVTVTATDSSSNKHSCSFTVTVTVTSCF